MGFVSTTLYCDGYGNSAQMIVRALTLAGVKIRFYRTNQFDDTLLDPIVRDVVNTNHWNADNRLFYHPPDAWLPKNKLRGTRNVGFTMFETTQIPKYWDKYINENAERLFVPSLDNKKLFRNCGVKIPIDVVPLGLEPSYWSLTEKVPRKDFVFMISGLLDKRKGADIAIEAFKESFKPHEKVKLLLKSRDGVFDYNNIKLDTKRMLLVDQRLSPQGMVELLSMVDCFVFPTRGEGFGLPPLEALATGTPVIVTNAGSTGDTFNSKYMFPIKNDGYEPCHYSGSAHWGDLGEWLNPSVEDCAEKMRYVYEHYDEAMEMAIAGSKWVKNKYNITNTANLIIKNLDKIGFF
jgi:glycosyltransferase involved in cell wall biosynthesis